VRLRSFIAFSPSGKVGSVAVAVAIFIALGCSTSTATSKSASALVDVDPVVIKRMSVPAEISRLSTEELIDRLQDEAPGDPGRRFPAFFWGFVPLDTPLPYERNLPRDARSPVMIELVTRGVTALPDLLRHLDDARPTKLELKHIEAVFDGGMALTDRYEYRFAAKKLQPPGVNLIGYENAHWIPIGGGYRFKVGDLCFIAVGLIVNRHLFPQNSVGNYVRSTGISSPVEIPALAQATRADWGRLTPAEHENSLRLDALSNTDPLRPIGALQRLVFYYPSAGKPLVKSLLERQLVEKAVASHNWDRQQVDYRRMESLVQQLAPFHWAALNAELSELLDRAADEHPLKLEGRLMRDELVLACGQHIGLEHCPEGLRFIQTEVTQLEKDRKTAREASDYHLPGSSNYEFLVLQSWLNRSIEQMTRALADSSSQSH